MSIDTKEMNMTQIRQARAQLMKSGMTMNEANKALGLVSDKYNPNRRIVREGDDIKFVEGQQQHKSCNNEHSSVDYNQRAKTLNDARSSSSENRFDARSAKQ